MAKDQATQPTTKAQPPTAPQTQNSVSWVTQAEEYLTSNGWERAGLNDKGHQLWQDPVGAGPQRAEKRVAGHLPNREGKLEPLEQYHVRTAAWAYATEEAVSIQRAREVAGGGGQPSVLDRLNDLGGKLDALGRDFDRLVAVVQKFLDDPAPEKQEQFVLKKRALAANLKEVLAARKGAA